MTLFVSDAHLGRGTREATREAERALVAMLRAHEAEVVGGGGRLVFVGDLFDQWIEYKHLAPKEGVRLLGLLADWCDRGAEVHYVVGNRDPWHVDLFEREIGVRLWRGPWRAELEGWRTYIAHGDAGRPPQRAVSRILHRFHPLVRHAATARLYRSALPGDAGYGLARWVSRRFGTDGTPDPAAARRVDADAEDAIRTFGVDLAVMGHSHAPVLRWVPRAASGGTTPEVPGAAAPSGPPHARGPRGAAYLNPGYWFGARTFGRLDARGPALLRWTGSAAETLRTL